MPGLGRPSSTAQQPYQAVTRFSARGDRAGVVWLARFINLARSDPG